MTSGSRGAARERELVNRFDAAGWGALRLPSSGSATARELPDVLAGRPVEATPKAGWTHPKPTRTYARLWAAELKSGAQTTLYVDAQEVDALRAFAETWGARPLLGARYTFGSGEHYDRTDTYLIKPEDARRTDGGAFGLPVEDIDDRAFAVVTDAGVERL